ncbi:hypothetical protein [Pyxidicoccus xibeiensis]|uniref:hypothetical protein n=1 Tax=Pyxidicoccus xibeiensis TaxID=2906759 RepID=UPI0020A77E3B|nr:hypothetical protein [Pyxidicoccus xibeiensis]MCP3140383.1 hypothetical protein [Pyxidicoccus xibeiensis]
MSFFERFQDSRLYVASTSASDAGWLAYVLPIGAPPQKDGLELEAALSEQSGSFLFSATAPDLLPPGALTTFLQAVDAVLAASPASRGFMWLADLSGITPATTPLMGLDSWGSRVTTALVAPIEETLSLNVQGGMTLTLQGEALLLSGQGGIFFDGASSPGGGQVTQVSSALLPLSGPGRGALQFAFWLQRQFLHDGFDWGFQLLIPTTDPVRTAVGAWLPLAAGYLPAANDLLGFTVSFDPSDVFNRRVPVANRSVLTFTGQNQDGSPTVLSSFYATAFGAPVTLVPVAGPLDAEPRAARLLFNSGPLDGEGNHDFQLAPEGDFVLALDGAEPGRVYDLLCGLQGTEYLAFQPRIAGGYAGDRLRFTSRQPAYAPRYPFTEASPVGPPVDLQAPLLDGTFTTAWATVARAPSAQGGIAYVAQPKGASLYGRDGLIFPQGQKTLFGPLDPSLTLPEGTPFPMVPYAGVSPGDGLNSFTPAQLEEFERLVVGPTRSREISKAAPATAPSKAALLGLVAAQAAPFNTTTPSGLLATVGPDGRWSRLLLAQNLSPTPRQLCFNAPDEVLQQAFQTSDLLLVVANAQHLGTLSGADGCPGGGTSPTFCNRMNVGDWLFDADVGQRNRYGDYASVMIVKGRRGALFDPSSPSTSLVASPDKWTAKDVFAAPSDLRDNPSPPPAEVPGAPNPAELTSLSFWLQQYFQDAADQPETEYFAKFNAIAKDPNWTGILLLRTKVTPPQDLIGVLAGVAAPERFNAHHLGIEISQVANDPSAPDIQVKDSSSLFGLVYYVDPEFTSPAAGAQAQPVPPTPGLDYDFRLLSLKALFENTSVRAFQSYAQLTLNRLLGMPVVGMGEGGNGFNSLVLRGAYQDNGGRPVYSLRTTAESTFLFDNDVLSKVEVDSAQLTTRSARGAEDVVSWFGLSGFLDFKVVTGRFGEFDVFSFGSDAGQDQLRRGLSFSDLGLRMAFPLGDPSQRTMTFVTDALRFDPATSTPRPGSLFTNFALSLEGLQLGTEDSPPTGYTDVLTDAALTGVAGGPWYGLRYRLDLGTPGALAGSVGLASYLLTAWSPEAATASGGDGPPRYQAWLGLQLPGTGGGANLISLQNVLKLSVGPIRLTYDADQRSFLLMLTEMALKLLGLLKLPPSGSTLFYLFGNPQAAGRPSGLGWYAMYRRTPPASSTTP